MQKEQADVLVPPIMALTLSQGHHTHDPPTPKAPLPTESHALGIRHSTRELGHTDRYSVHCTGQSSYFFLSLPASLLPSLHLTHNSFLHPLLLLHPSAQVPFFFLVSSSRNHACYHNFNWLSREQNGNQCLRKMKT